MRTINLKLMWMILAIIIFSAMVSALPEKSLIVKAADLKML